MKVSESRCVDCGLSCAGCTYLTPRMVIYCDACENEAFYHVSDFEVDDDMCEDCTKEYLENKWNKLSSAEKLEIFDSAADEEEADELWFECTTDEQATLTDTDLLYLI